MQNAYPLQFAPRVLWAKRSGTSEGKTGRKGSGPAGTWGVSPAAARAFAFATVGTRARVARADDISRTHTSGRRRGSPKTGCAVPPGLRGQTHARSFSAPPTLLPGFVLCLARGVRGLAQGHPAGKWLGLDPASGGAGRQGQHLVF